MEFLTQLKELGIAPWILTAAAILWILSTLGILQAINNAGYQLYQLVSSRITDNQEHSQNIQLTEAQSKKLASLRDEYSQNYLMEQVSVNHAESQVQLGDANQFIRERYVKLEDEIKGELSKNAINLEQIKEDIENMMNTFDKQQKSIFIELDIINRNLEEFKENVFRRI